MNKASELLREEVEAFKRRAEVELCGESGSVEIPYRAMMITIYCDKGIAKKMKFFRDGVAIQRNL
jgi:putative transposon-encoded protein